MPLNDTLVGHFGIEKPFWPTILMRLPWRSSPHVDRTDVSNRTKKHDAVHLLHRRQLRTSTWIVTGVTTTTVTEKYLLFSTSAHPSQKSLTRQPYYFLAIRLDAKECWPIFGRRKRTPSWFFTPWPNRNAFASVIDGGKGVVVKEEVPALLWRVSVYNFVIPARIWRE